MTRLDPRAVIMALRDGRGLAADDARAFADGLASGAVEDAQAGAFAMAVLLKGLGADGRVALTRAMRDSGVVLDWHLPGPVVDKHSTGGVGDSVSLILAPALAACGAYVPMISGRGLGHTGGTLDKMEAIPGYRTDIDRVTLERVLREAGCAIIGATADLAPADRRLYAIRDISGTVESIDLITASILSKKLAAGLDALVLDVKCGGGAFMPDRASARALADALVQTANGAGCRTTALITDMNSPLARNAGNAIEVAEVIAALTDPAAHLDSPLMQVTVALGAEALLLAGLAASTQEGAAQITAALTTGAAAERFARMVAALGGPSDLLEQPQRHLHQAPALSVTTPEGGHIHAIDTRALGDLVVRLGGGRLRQSDRIDHGVGLRGLPRIGAYVAPGAALADILAATPEAAHAAIPDLLACFAFGPDDAPASPLVLDRITA